MKQLTITIPAVCPACNSQDLLVYVTDGELTTLKCRDCKAGYSARDIALQADHAEGVHRVFNCAACGTDRCKLR